MSCSDIPLVDRRGSPSFLLDPDRPSLLIDDVWVAAFNDPPDVLYPPCPLCLDTVSGRRLVLPCGHSVHWRCFVDWLITLHHMDWTEEPCPICGYRLLP